MFENIAAAMAPDPTERSGRCSPERGCHEVTGVEMMRIVEGLVLQRFIGVGRKSEAYLSYGLRGVGKGGVNDAHFHRYAINH